MSTTKSPRIPPWFHRLVAERNPGGDTLPCPTCEHGVFVNPELPEEDRLDVMDLLGAGVMAPVTSRRAPHKWTCSDCGSRHALEDYRAKQQEKAA